MFLCLFSFFPNSIHICSWVSLWRCFHLTRGWLGHHRLISINVICTWFIRYLDRPVARSYWHWDHVAVVVVRSHLPRFRRDYYCHELACHMFCWLSVLQALLYRLVRSISCHCMLCPVCPWFPWWETYIRVDWSHASVRLPSGVHQ